jgi:hypothetical protein
MVLTIGVVLLAVLVGVAGIILYLAPDSKDRLD